MSSAIKEASSLDSSLGHTFLLLLSKPGMLSLEFIQGRGKSQMPPLRLYLVISAIYILIGFSTSLNVEAMLETLKRLNGTEYAKILGLLNQKADLHNLQLVAFVNLIDNRIETYLNVLLPLTVLPFALVAKLLFRRTNLFYVDHLVFCLHFYCFSFLLSSLLGVSLYFVPSAFQFMPYVIILANIIYFYFAAKRFYDYPKVKQAFFSILCFSASLLLKNLVIWTIFSLAIIW